MPRLGAWILLALVVAGPAAALETDQFLVWERDLADATPAVNAFLNDELDRALAQVNGAPAALGCAAIPTRFYRRLVPTLLVYSRIRSFLNTDPAVERFPGRDVGYFGYLERSIYRRPTWPFLLPMARTVSIGGVDVGIDKVAGHMFGFGRRYYRRYQRLRSRGWSEEDALRRVIRRGLHNELTLVGGLADGVFSLADLEANYRGLLLARDFCEGPAPLLERGEEGWRAARPIDLAAYVNPLLDETFNASLYASYRWRRVRDPLVAYCPERATAAIAERMRRYAAAAPPSLSAQVVREHLERRAARLLERSIDVACLESEAEPGQGVAARPAGR